MNLVLETNTEEAGISHWETRMSSGSFLLITVPPVFMDLLSASRVNQKVSEIMDDAVDVLSLEDSSKEEGTHGLDSIRLVMAMERRPCVMKVAGTTLSLSNLCFSFIGIVIAQAAATLGIAT